jgi:16S rRNA (adenine1518-N6/adenine1519-N6)-dimethyltransferase
MSLALPTRDELTELARSFHTKKHLGQNFLVDADCLEFIAQELDAQASDTIIEVGSGIGFLTRFLVGSQAPVTAVELDSECISILKQIKTPNLNIVHGDFLEFELPKDGSLKVCGNVPYQITSRILSHVFGEIGDASPWAQAIKKVVLTVQYEVAERFVAQPGGRDYSQITLLVDYFAKARILKVLDGDSFYPPPKVRSAVVSFTPWQTPPIECQDHRLLRKVIKASFSQRRKMLKNNLGFLKLDDSTINKVFAKLNMDPQTIAERLSLAQFARLSDELGEVYKP